MDNLYASLEKRYMLPEGTLSAVESTESGGNDAAISSKGAKGRFQFMPATAEAYGVDTSDKVSSAHGAAKYLSDLQNQYGSFKAALAHYNGGTKAAKAVLAGQEPPAEETKNYLKKVNSRINLKDEDITWNEPKSSVASSNIKDEDIVWDKSTEDLSKKSGLELFGKGLKASGQTTMTGIGQVLDPLAQQLEQTFPAVSRFGQKLGMPSAKEAAAGREAEILAQREANKPLLETSAGLAGNITGELGQAVMLPGGTIGKAALAGAGMGAVQPTLPEESRAYNIGSGAVLGAAGQGVVNALGKVAQPITNQLGEIGANAVKTLRDAGIPLDAAQATGSALLGRVKAALSDNPFTAGAQNEFSGVQKQAFNKAIAKTMGENADRITPAVISNAKENIGKIYDDVASKVNIRADDKFLNNLSAIDDEAKNILNDQQYSIIDKNIKNIINKASIEGNQLNASQYQNIKKTLDRLSSSSDTDVAGYARDLRDVLNKGLSDSAEATGNKELVTSLKEANKRWGNMRKIEDVALKNAEGDISPSLLYNSLTTKAKRNAFYAEDNELSKLAAAGKIVLPEKLPNSGTIARGLAQAAVPAAAGAAYGLYQGDYVDALKGAAFGIAAPKLAQAAINNPKLASYLEKGVGNTALRNLLQTPSKMGAGKIPLASYESYLQQVQKEKGTK